MGDLWANKKRASLLLWVLPVEQFCEAWLQWVARTKSWTGSWSGYGPLSKQAYVGRDPSPLEMPQERLLRHSTDWGSASLKRFSDLHSFEWLLSNGRKEERMKQNWTHTQMPSKMFTTVNLPPSCLKFYRQTEKELIRCFLRRGRFLS